MKRILTISMLAISVLGLAQSKVQKSTKQKETTLFSKPLVKGSNGEYKLYYATMKKDTLFLFNDGVGQLIAEVWKVDTIKRNLQRKPIIILYQEQKITANIKDVNIKNTKNSNN